MKTSTRVGLFVGVFVAMAALYFWFRPTEIRHYTEAELLGLTCAELSEAHEEVIFAYHDAALAHYRRTGAFEDDLGLPKADVLPIIIVMKAVVRDNDLTGVDATRPFFHSASATAPRLNSDFFSEVTRVCASNPAKPAPAAVLQAAQTLGLTRKRAAPQ